MVFCLVSSGEFRSAGILSPRFCFAYFLGNVPIVWKTFSILYNTEAFESQSGFNRRNLGVIARQHLLNSLLRDSAQWGSNDLSELNMRIKVVEVESCRRITLIDLNGPCQTAQALFENRAEVDTPSPAVVMPNSVF
jgi:hypothetical protein